MNITFLGTGTSQGVPVIACDCAVCRSDDPRDQRLRCAVLIEEDGREPLHLGQHGSFAPHAGLESTLR